MGMDASMILQGAGAASNMMGAYRSAAGQKAALQYQANVAANNQRIAQDQARVALQNGEVAETDSELKTAALMGDQRAALAANGVALGEGSPSEILTTSKFMGTRDALTIRDAAARQAWASQQQGKGYGAEAAMDKSVASSMNPWTSAFGSLLTDAGKVAKNWYPYDRATNGVQGDSINVLDRRNRVPYGG